MRRILLWPLYLPTLLTGAKSFKNNPVIGNRVLNVLGLHVIRVIIAAFIMKLRRLPMIWMLSAEDRKLLAKQGYLLKENILPPEVFSALESEARQARLEARICIQGDAITHRVLLDENTLTRLPATRAALAHRPLQQTLAYVSGRFRVPGIWLQRIHNGVFPDKRDPQRTLHSDTFHPTMKAWLFLDDVDDARGPFNYVPGSHRLTFRRLAWEYRRSLEVCNEGDHYSASGSFRLGENDMDALGLPEPVAFRVPANSLVIADTHGFHCRGASDTGSSRLALWAISRTNPFNPLPGLPFKILNRLDLAIFRTHLRWQDYRAGKRGTLPSWKIAAPDWRPPSA